MTGLQSLVMTSPPTSYVQYAHEENTQSRSSIRFDGNSINKRRRTVIRKRIISKL